MYLSGIKDTVNIIINQNDKDRTNVTPMLHMYN